MSLIISGVIDGPLTGGLPKAIELTALADIPDLSIYGIGSANNGGGSDGQEFIFPPVPASRGDVIYIASESPGFTSFFGFAPDYTSAAASINGDDAIELFENGTVIDVFGDIDVDGTGQPWEYLDGWAYRSVSDTTPTTTFELANWTFSGPNALDAETANAGAGVPFPAGSYAASLPSAGPVIAAAEDFDGGAINLISGFDAATDNLDGGAGDWFGVASIAAWPQTSGVPFSLTDDSASDVSGGGVFPGDVEGIYGENADPDNDFFGISDSDEFGAAQTASWTFDILGCGDLQLAIDMGGISDSSFGGYSASTDVQFTVSIDGGPVQTIFDLDAVDPADAIGFSTRMMDDGDASGGGRLLQVTGDSPVTKIDAETGVAVADTFLDKATVGTGALDSFLANIAGTGATLTLTMTADVPFEAMAFDNIVITGTEAPVTGSIFSISALDAVKSEGDAGTASFTFTVTRSGDTSGTASLDFAVSGDVDAADFGGALPSGTVEFTDGETERTITLDVSGDVDEEADEGFTVALSNPLGGTIAVGSAAGRILNDDLSITMIHEIQGNAATWGEQFGRTDATPFFGATIAVSAIVVGDFQNGDADNMRNFGGFYLQEEDAEADGDATTSEGIFVFDGSSSLPVDVNVGDKITVVGEATEFFGETQIVASSILVESTGNVLPTAAEITFPIASAYENVDGQLIADLEAYEGMRVSVPQDLTVGDLFTYGRFGEIGLSAIGEIEAYTQNNVPDVAGFNAYLDEVVRNTVVIDDGRTVQNPDVLPYPDGQFGADDGLTSGDTVQDLVGVVRYSRSSGGSGDENYRINPTEAPTFLDTAPREETPPDVGGRLKVASFNVLNFFNGDGLGGGFPTSRGADTPEELARQTDKLVAAIAALDADVVGLIEIENDGFGPESAIRELIDALNAAGGSYGYVDPGTPGIGTDAIAVGFIYDTTSISLAGAAAILDKTVDARFDSDNQRPALAQTFVETATGASFTAVVNHLKSKGSPVAGTSGDEDQRDGAGNANTTRTNAAEALEDWLATDPTGSGDSDFLIVGDLNAYRMEDPIRTLLDGVDDIAGTSDDLTLLTEDSTFGFPADLSEAGQVQAFGALDYAIANASLASQVTGATAWKINSVEPGLIDYNLEFKPNDPGLYSPDAFRSSDHDPVIVGLDLDVPAPDAVIARVDFVEARGRDIAITTIDGVEVGVERLRRLQQEIEIDAAGLAIDASDGRFFAPEFVTTAGDGIGVWSLLPDRFFGSDRTLLNEREVLSFELADVAGLGDALEVEFEFATIRRSGEVELSFYDDGVEIDRVLLAVTNDMAGYDLSGDTTFDRVDIGVVGDLGLGISAVEFLRLEVDEFTFA